MRGHRLWWLEMASFHTDRYLPPLAHAPRAPHWQTLPVYLDHGLRAVRAAGRSTYLEPVTRQGVLRKQVPVSQHQNLKPDETRINL
jgi:hypothetical protein